MTTILGFAFVGLAVCAAALMMWLWGFPFDEEKGRSTAPRGYVWLHRLLGYCFIGVYIASLVLMAPRLWRYQEEFSAFAAIHAFLAVAIGAVLLVKIAIVRLFPAFRKFLPVFGISLVVLVVTALAMPLALSVREWAVSRGAVGLDTASRRQLAAATGAETALVDAAATSAGLRLGRIAMLDNCTQCHSMRRILTAAKTPAQWTQTVRRMGEKADASGYAPIPESERLAIGAYLSAVRGLAPEPTPAPAEPAAVLPVPTISHGAATPAPPPPTAKATPSGSGSTREGEVLALFSAHCVMCHNGPGASKGVRLETLELAAGSSAVVPGQPDQSELIRRVRGLSSPRMPLNGPPYLTEQQISLLEEWITSLDASPLGGASERPRVLPGAPASTPPPATPLRTPIPTPAPTPTPIPIPGASETVRFDHIQHILMNSCVKCHTPNGLMGAAPEGLVLSDWASIFETPERPVVLPGRPDASLLARHITGREQPRMPLDGPPFLDEQQTSLILRWIADGARDADGRPAPIPVGREVRMRGILEGRWRVDGAAFTVTGSTEVREARVGSMVEVRAIVGPNGELIAERVRGR